MHCAVVGIESEGFSRSSYHIEITGKTGIRWWSLQDGTLTKFDVAKNTRKYVETLMNLAVRSHEF